MKQTDASKNKDLDKAVEERNRRMDSIFKENLKMEGFIERDDKKSLGKFYNPDMILENDDTVIFFESSSTGDRKVHIGELTQFLSYVNLGVEEKKKIYYVLFLCGNSETSPTVEKEYDRLRYYFENHTMKNSERNKIKGMYIANQNDVDISKLTLEQIEKFKRIDIYE